MCVHMYVYMCLYAHMCSAHKGQRKTLYSLEFVNCHVGAKT